MDKWQINAQADKDTDELAAIASSLHLWSAVFCFCGSILLGMVVLGGMLYVSHHHLPMWP